MIKPSNGKRMARQMLSRCDNKGQVELYYSHITLHCGTNELKGEMSADDIFEEILKVEKSLVIKETKYNVQNET